MTETWAHLDVTGQFAPFYGPVVAEGDVQGLFQSMIEQLALLLDAKERLAAAEADHPGGNDPGGNSPIGSGQEYW